MTEKIGAWIGLISTSITILLTVLNYQLNSRLQEAEAALKNAEASLTIVKTELEVSREKTERYEFVNKLLPDLLVEDSTRVILTSNLITLVMSEEEAKKLFAGLSSSKDQKAQAAGRTGLETFKNRQELARELELQGIDALIAGDFN